MLLKSFYNNRKMQVLFPNHHSSQWQWLSDMLPLTSKAKQVLQSWGYQKNMNKNDLNTAQFKYTAKLLHGCLNQNSN